MRRLFVLLAAAILAVPAALAQPASPTELEIVTDIAKCLVRGLPQDWVTAHMEFKLDSPGATRGDVFYQVARKGAEDKLESFTPCDPEMPPNLLLRLRGTQEKQDWRVAKLVVERDGSFRLNYQY